VANDDRVDIRQPPYAITPLHPPADHGGPTPVERKSPGMSGLTHMPPEAPPEPKLPVPAPTEIARRQFEDATKGLMKAIGGKQPELVLIKFEEAKAKYVNFLAAEIRGYEVPDIEGRYQDKLALAERAEDEASAAIGSFPNPNLKDSEFNTALAREEAALAARIDAKDPAKLKAALDYEARGSLEQAKTKAEGVEDKVVLKNSPGMRTARENFLAADTKYRESPHPILLRNAQDAARHYQVECAKALKAAEAAAGGATPSEGLLPAFRNNLHEAEEIVKYVTSGLYARGRSE
jgi:hypothetical protein